MVKTNSSNDKSAPNSTYLVAEKGTFVKSYEPELDNLRGLIKNYRRHYSVVSESLDGSYHDYREPITSKQRQQWYELISSNIFCPNFDSESGLRLFTSEHNVKADNLPYQLIEQLVTAFILSLTENAKNGYEIETVIDLLVGACSQLARYLPEFEKKKPKYFVDAQSAKLGVVFQKNGTLTLLIGTTSEIEYSFAQQQSLGTVRISGKANLTKHIANSKSIWKILNLQGLGE